MNEAQDESVIRILKSTGAEIHGQEKRLLELAQVHKVLSLKTKKSKNYLLK